VKLGVVLVQFAGAEGATSGARAKPDAFKRAQELAEQARTDWKATVKAGDTGSSEDIGRMPRGVLDRATEVAVFSLGAGDISEPLETPRGYWVVKRLE
jgi:parvulin-like peptidyl-prolyl isomerase